MVEWHYEMTEGAWGNRSGTALSMKAAKRSMRADLRSRYPGAKLPRLVKQPSLPDTQLYDLEGEDYEGFASFTTLDPEGMAEFTAGWGEEPSPYPLANPLALDNWGQAIGRSVMLLARSPAVKRMAVFVGRELGREALTHLLNMSKEERGAWLYKNLRRIPYLSSQLDRLSPEQKVAVTQAVAGALENKQVQRAIDKQLAHKVSANPRARNNFFGPFKAEKTAPRMTYVEGMERAQDMAADAKQRLALRHGWKGYFLVKMPKVRGSGHVWFYLSSVTLREMGRASVYGAPQTKITASNPWATVLRNLDAIRDPSGYQIVELDTLTGKVTGPLSYPQVQDRSGVKAAANPRISDAEIQRKAPFYIDSFWEYAAKYGYREARDWLHEGPFRDFRVWMRVHPNTKHLAPMLRSTRRHHFRNWNQHDFEKLLGLVAAGTRPESRTNPKKKRRKAKRRNVHHEDALSRKTTRGHKRKERKRSVAKGYSRKPKHKGQAKLNPAQDLKAQVHAFAERLRSWNLKYDEFPDIRAWVTQNWTAPYGADAALDYLNGVAERRSESYWGQSTRSRQDIADEAERSRRLRAVYSDLAGDEVRQNPRLTRRPQAPYVWEENIYKNGKLVETVYYDDIQAFFRDIEQANPGGNQQVYDNWKEGSARHSTGYTDGAGDTWDLYFSKMRDKRARFNP